jgi:hypothetical protein
VIKNATFRAGTPALPPEECPIDLRAPEGRLIRKITRLEADRVVQSGLGFRRGKHEVRLAGAGVRPDGKARTWLGSQQAGRVRASAYGHNERVCSTWLEKDGASPNAGGGKS